MAGGGLVELALLDAGDAGEQQPGQRAHERVQLRDGVVVVLPGEGELVLGVGELALEVEEVLVGLEVGVVLGDRVEVDQRPLHGGVGGGLGVDVVALRRGLEARPRAGDLLEDRLLVRGVPLDRVDEVRDQVGATGELDVDAAQRLLGADVRGAQLVEADDGEPGEGDQHRDDDDCGHDRPSLSVELTPTEPAPHHEPPPPPPPPPPPEKPPPPPLLEDDRWVAS